MATTKEIPSLNYFYDEQNSSDGKDEYEKQMSERLKFWRMPAEWEYHCGCMLLYPHNIETFRGENCNFAKEQFIEVSKAISCSGGEPVFLFCKDGVTARNLQDELIKRREIEGKDGYVNIEVKVLDSDDTWARDTAPTFLIRRKDEDVMKTNNTRYETDLIACDWDFNAYGGPEEGCYWPCERDRCIARGMTKIISQHFHLGIERLSYYDDEDNKGSLRFILEGGSIHTDGEGTILTTEEVSKLKHYRP